MDLKPVIEIAVSNYRLPLDGIHGPRHWARVLENGLRLAELTGANPDVVSLFALLHDCKRQDDEIDPLHGERAADLVATIPLPISSADRFRLVTACQFHNGGSLHNDPTIGTCWDADRLDLKRVGCDPFPGLLNTEAAKSEEIIAWASERAASGYVSPLLTEWGVASRGELLKNLSGLEYLRGYMPVAAESLLRHPGVVARIKQRGPAWYLEQIIENFPDASYDHEFTPEVVARLTAEIRSNHAEALQIVTESWEKL